MNGQERVGCSKKSHSMREKFDKDIIITHQKNNSKIKKGNLIVKRL